jgi:hypothetical protein
MLKEEAPPYRVAAKNSPSPGGDGRGEGGRLRFIDLFCGIGGFRIAFELEFPEFPAEGPKLASILDPDVPVKYTLTDHPWN